MKYNIDFFIINFSLSVTTSNYMIEERHNTGKDLDIVVAQVHLSGGYATNGQGKHFTKMAQ